MAEEPQRQMWAGYTRVVIDYAQNPRNVGSIQDADGFASVTGPCGDTMEIWLRVRNGAIQETSFWTDGCGTTIAAGSMVTELAKGKAIIEALRTTQQDVLNALGGFTGRECPLRSAGGKYPEGGYQGLPGLQEWALEEGISPAEKCMKDANSNTQIIGNCIDLEGGKSYTRHCIGGRARSLFQQHVG